MNKSLLIAAVGVIVAGALVGYLLFRPIKEVNIQFDPQIPIRLVDEMPKLPYPYLMRDWEQVTRDYIAFVWDDKPRGEHSSLIWRDEDSTRFGLATAVGQQPGGAGEAINVLPALISAKLVNIDMRDYTDINWVSPIKHFFNIEDGVGVYANNPGEFSGGDWWYSTMPNVFFYQLYDLYNLRDDPEFRSQFIAVADSWLKSVVALNGSASPWKPPYMNYWAFSLRTMMPVNGGGVTQPEAAGAIAWLLYMAYIETGEARYRIGAELAMDYFAGLKRNPLYELQIYYGVQAAVRMNAELGTTFDIEKMINWTFEPGNVRGWGTGVGNWGGLDVAGLSGGHAGFAFSMNGFQHVGTLVPVVRYDDRFARAIGKFVLNIANAQRLFYPRYLPSGKHQGASDYKWASEHDPNSVMLYEALRNFCWEGRFSPFGTGDFIRHGWGPSDLTLYSASSVGKFGSIIDTTNVEGILKLDVLATDFFGTRAFPTYLYYNPHNEEKSVTIDLGEGQFDLYDAVTNRFILQGLSGETAFTISADQATLLIITPADGKLTLELDKTLVDGVVIDFRSGREVANHPPRIRGLAVGELGVSITIHGPPHVHSKYLGALDTALVFAGTTHSIFCTAVDMNNDELSFNWSATGGTIEDNGSMIVWTAPGSLGSHTIVCVVDDGQGGQSTAQVRVEVVEAFPNQPPKVFDLTIEPARVIHLGETVTLKGVARDPNYDNLTYTWSHSEGKLTGEGATVTWTAPQMVGDYQVSVTVDDGRGGQFKYSVTIAVRDMAGIEMISHDIIGLGLIVQNVFTKVGNLSNDDLLQKIEATLRLVEGEMHPESGGLERLTDGLWSTSADAPSDVVFFGGEGRGKVSIDLKSLVDVAEISLFSRHRNNRTAQEYSVYGTKEETVTDFDTSKAAIWTRIGSIHSGHEQGGGGFDGVIGSSIKADPGVALGQYRHLLFVIEDAPSLEGDGTFVAEIDVFVR